MHTALRSILAPGVVSRLILGWGAFAALLFTRPLFEGQLSGPALILVLIAIISVIVVCAFGVVHEAEHLARRLGDPYGTLVLTLSIVLIEIILISAVMLGPGAHPTIARDSVMAVSMIILNLVVGAALLVGGLRHRTLRANSTGVSAYLAMLIVLIMLAFALPGFVGRDGSYTPSQAILIAAMTLFLYAFFLSRQMGRQRDDFQEISLAAKTPDATPQHPDSDQRRNQKVIAEHRTEILARFTILVLTVTPIVLLSHDMSTLLDDGLTRIDAPVALSGIIIAFIVFLPETLTAVRAALAGEMQRVSNLCHGALVSTVGLTIPAVLLIGLLTGQQVVLAENTTNLLLLAVTLLLTLTTFAGKRVPAANGAVHLAMFFVYGLTVFA